MKADKKILKAISIGLAISIFTTSSLLGVANAKNSSKIREELKRQENAASNIKGSLNNMKNAVDANKSKIENLNEIINNYKSVIKESESDKASANNQLQEILSKKDSVVSKIALLNEKIKETIQAIDKLESQIIELEDKIEETKKEIKRLEGEVKNNTKLLEERLVVMYKQGSVGTLQVLLSASDLNDFLSRQTMMGTITSHDKKLIAQLKSDKEALAVEKIKLEGEKTALEITKENLKEEKKSLEEDKKVQDTLYEQLRKEQGLKEEEINYLKSLTKEYEGYLLSTLDNKKKLSGEIARREAEIANLEAGLRQSLNQISNTKTELKKTEAAEAEARRKAQKEARRKAEAEARRKREELERKKKELERLRQAREAQKKEAAARAKQTSKKIVDTKAATPKPAASKPAVSKPSIARTGSGFNWPAGTTYVTSYFGWRYLFGARDFHRGIDIGGPGGTSIYASKSGTVIFAGWSGSYGKLVRIKHSDGSETRYAHLSTYFVSPGQGVSAGQQIAAMGSTGNSTGPHLHFEILFGGSPVNPMGYLR